MILGGCTGDGKYLPPRHWVKFMSSLVEFSPPKWGLVVKNVCVCVCQK